MSRTLWIVDPSLQSAEDEGAGEVERAWGGPSRRFLPALRPGDDPSAADDRDVAAVAVLGSAASVHDRREWLDALAAWLAPIVSGRRRLPLLGICFGHQLVAHLAGAPVGWLDPTSRAKRVGIETTSLGPGVLGPGAPSAALRVVVSHRELVAAVPRGFRAIGSRDGVPVDALAHATRPILTYQFHPEARGEFAGRAGIDPAAIDARVIGDSRRALDAFRALAVGERSAR